MDETGGKEFWERLHTCTVNGLTGLPACVCAVHLCWGHSLLCNLFLKEDDLCLGRNGSLELKGACGQEGGGNGELDVEQKNKKKETISSVQHPHRSGSKQTVSMSVNGTAPPLHHSFFFFLLFPFSCLTVRQKCSEAFRCCYGNRRQPKWGKDELTPHRRTFIFLKKTEAVEK